mgnify:CR=1 FL=1
MNKTFLLVSQVFSILGAVLIGFYFLLFLFIGVGYSYGGLLNSFIFPLFLFAALVSIYIVASVRFQKAKTTPNMKTEVMIWGILLLIGPSFIGGVFAIIAANTQSSENSSGGSEKSVEVKLKELDNLFDKGIISMEEYQLRRKRILENI